MKEKKRMTRATEVLPGGWLGSRKNRFGGASIVDGHLISQSANFRKLTNIRHVIVFHVIIPNVAPFCKSAARRSMAPPPLRRTVKIKAAFRLYEAEKRP